MFKRSNEELKKLEQQLLAVEEPKVEEDEFEVFYEDILKEFGPDEQPAPAKMKTHKTNHQTTDYTDVTPHPRKKHKSIRGMIVTLCLECMGILAVLVWWMVRYL